MQPFQVECAAGVHVPPHVAFVVPPPLWWRPLAAQVPLLAFQSIHVALELVAPTLGA
jgi:hypothetical protein